MLTNSNSAPIKAIAKTQKKRCRSYCQLLLRLNKKKKSQIKFKTKSTAVMAQATSSRKPYSYSSQTEKVRGLIFAHAVYIYLNKTFIHM